MVKYDFTLLISSTLQRYINGDNLTVVFLGGSIAAGQGAVDGMGFPMWAESILHEAMGKRVVVHNGAVPGTFSAFSKRLEDNLKVLRCMHEDSPLENMYSSSATMTCPYYDMLYFL